MKELVEVNDKIKQLFKERRDLFDKFVKANADMPSEEYFSFLMKQAPSLMIEHCSSLYGKDLASSRRELTYLKNHLKGQDA